VARHYQGLIDGFVLDSVDEDARAEIKAMGMAVKITNTLMNSLEDRVSLATDVLEFATLLRSAS
jgi:LPPG:FO 2-phospho-L-lactate transferase